MINNSSSTIFYNKLADELSDDKTITKTKAEEIFSFFKNCDLFRWQDANNDCEDRANAICILLDKWNIPNYKGWIFSGYFLKKNLGSLQNGWKYHVAALLPVKENDTTEYYIIDPATSQNLITISEWATKITAGETSFHFIKHGVYYIFPIYKIEEKEWHKRDKRNHRWTMQGLGGINGLSAKGKSQLAFNKNRVTATMQRFKKIMHQSPFN